MDLLHSVFALMFGSIGLGGELVSRIQGEEQCPSASFEVALSLLTITICHGWPWTLI